MKKKNFLIITLIALMMIFIVACSNNEESSPDDADSKEPSYSLKYGNVHNNDHPFNEAYEQWAKNVEEKTDGDLKIEIYPDGQLGEESDILEQMSQGANVGYQTDAARLGNYVNDISVLLAPYFLDNQEQIEGLNDSETVQEWITELEEQHGLKVVALNYIQGFRNVFSTKSATNSEELSKQKIRAAGAPIWKESVRAIGTKPVELDYGDIYNGIQTGVVDGAEVPNIAAEEELQLYEVADYMIETEHIFQNNFLVVGADWFNSLPEDYQNIVIDEAEKQGTEGSNGMLDNAEAAKEHMIDEGIEYIPQEDLDIEGFRKAGQKAYEELDLNDAKEKVYSDLGIEE